MTDETKKQYIELLKRLKKAHEYYDRVPESQRKTIYAKAEPVIAEMQQLFPDDDMQTFCDLLIIFGTDFVRFEKKT